MKAFAAMAQATTAAKALYDKTKELIGLGPSRPPRQGPEGKSYPRKTTEASERAGAPRRRLRAIHDLQSSVYSTMTCPYIHRCGAQM